MIRCGAGHLPGSGRVGLPRDGGLERGPSRSDSLFQRCPLDRRLGHGFALRGGAPFRIGESPSRGFSFRLARRTRSTKGGRLLAPCLAGHPQRAQLGQSVCKGALRVADRGVKLEIARRDGLGESPTLNGEACLGRRPFVAEAGPVATGRLEVATETGLAKSKLGQRRPCGIVGLAASTLGLGSFAQLGSDRGGRVLGGLRCRHRPVGLASFVVSARAGLGRPAGCVVPPNVGRQDERLGQIVAGRQPRRLLLGLGSKPTSLWPQLREDVLDPREVCFRLDELILGLAPAPLVTPNPGDLLEERATLLRPQGERLVDHALADEQERVVGEVRRVEQVDEIAQADPLLVQQVVVLAAAVEPSTELQDRVLDRQEPVCVVEDERDVGHAKRRPAIRTGEDHVLGPATAECAALLPERPAKGVGEVALARPVGPDDGADPATELDDCALGERLEALEAKREEAAGLAVTAAALTVADSAW